MKRDFVDTIFLVDENGEMPVASMGPIVILLLMIFGMIFGIAGILNCFLFRGERVDHICKHLKDI